MFSDLSEVIIGAKKGDIKGNFKVFVLGVGFWGCGWVVGGGEIHVITVGFVTDFFEGQN